MLCIAGMVLVGVIDQCLRLIFSNLFFSNLFFPTLSKRYITFTSAIFWLGLIIFKKSTGAALLSVPVILFVYYLASKIAKPEIKFLDKIINFSEKLITFSGSIIFLIIFASLIFKNQWFSSELLGFIITFEKGFNDILFFLSYQLIKYAIISLAGFVLISIIQKLISNKKLRIFSYFVLFLIAMLYVYFVNDLNIEMFFSNKLAWLMGFSLLYLHLSYLIRETISLIKFKRFTGYRIF